MMELWSSYSDAELKLILRFITQGCERMLGAVEHLKTMTEPSKGEGASAPSKGRRKGPK
jgi:hypothetical protein